jgi:hypothetical protein
MRKPPTNPNETSPRNPLASHQVRRSQRRGIGQIEIIITAIIVGTLAGLLSTLSYQITRVQKDARHYQLAVYELANQLRRINQLPKEAVDSEISKLALSATIVERIPSAKLQGRIIKDKLGKRVELELSWERVGTPEPLRMTTWISTITGPDASENPTAPTLESQSDEKPATGEPS